MGRPAAPLMNIGRFANGLRKRMRRLGRPRSALCARRAVVCGEDALGSPKKAIRRPQFQGGFPDGAAIRLQRVEIHLAILSPPVPRSIRHPRKRGALSTSTTRPITLSAGSGRSSTALASPRRRNRQGRGSPPGERGLSIATSRWAVSFRPTRERTMSPGASSSGRAGATTRMSPSRIAGRMLPPVARKRTCLLYTSPSPRDS